MVGPQSPGGSLFALLGGGIAKPNREVPVKAFELVAALAGAGGSKLQDSQLRDSPALGP
jgi:hypothetical protein